VANFMLAAHSLGVGSIAQAALAAYPQVLRAQLDIDTERTIVCGISFGLADPDHPANQFRPRRAPIADAVRWCE
jgi:nitroreductase